MPDTKKNILDTIQTPADLQALCDAELGLLAAQIRERLIASVSQTGGHLASNLGVVELTLALHRVFDCPRDKLVFDVGHQAYVHKMLTGRAGAMLTLRTRNGLSGFPKRAESVYDAFDAGHSSTSISAALGILRAARLQGSDEHVVAVIGDGALTGGMAFEALNDAGQSELPLIVVLNDNGMSISRNVGALNRHLNAMRSSRGYQRFKQRMETFLERLPLFGEKTFVGLTKLKNRIKYFLLPNVFFEELGFKYWGPIDGHDIKELTDVFQRAKELRRPVVVHAVTQKGRGYAPAESMPEKFHGVGKFDPATGATADSARRGNSAVFGDALCRAAQTDGRLAVVCAAMPIGTGMQEFAFRYPARFFDVGIAEQHAVTMAAGMAARGMRPVVAVYSTFLQRAYDSILHDVCLQRLPVVFGVDRAGLVGEDGETHQGVYDISYLLSMPYIQLWSPATQAELAAMAHMALEADAPVAIRYGRTALPEGEKTTFALGEWEVLRPLRPVSVVATGRLVQAAAQAVAALDVGLVNARFIRPMDDAVLERMAAQCRYVITLEDALASCGFGAQAALRLGGGVRVVRMGVGDVPVPHGAVREQDALCSLLPEDIHAAVLRGLEAVQ